MFSENIISDIAAEIIETAAYSVPDTEAVLYPDNIQHGAVQFAIQDLVTLANDCIHGSGDSLHMIKAYGWAKNAGVGDYAIVLDADDQPLRLEWLAGTGVIAYIHAFEIIDSKHVATISKMFNAK